MAHIFAVALALSIALGLGVFQTAQANPLTIGSVNTDPMDEMKEWLPFAQYVAGELSPQGIVGGKVVVARNGGDMAVLLKTGKVDLYIDSPLVILDVAKASGAKLLVRRWKKGAPEYTSVVFARKDAGIATLDDLKNKVIAFEKDASSTGYLLPWLEMHRAGLRIQLLDNRATAPQSGHVGFRFSGADRNTIAWVLHGRVIAGATSREDFDKIVKDQRAQLAVIFETNAIPRHVVAYRPDLPPALVARIRDVLLAMDQSELGRQVLSKFEKTAKFDDIPPQSLERLMGYQEALREARGAP